MNHFTEFTRANDKDALIYETKLSLKKSFGINVSTDLIKRVVNARSDSVRQAMENKVPRIILPGLGSITIKKGRESYLKKAGKLDDKRGLFKYKFEIVTKEDA